MLESMIELKVISTSMFQDLFIKSLYNFFNNCINLINY